MYRKTHTHTHAHAHTRTHTHTGNHTHIHTNAHVIHTFLTCKMPIAVRRRQPKSKGGGDGGLMADIQSQATKQMAREAVKMGMGMLF